MEKEKYIKRLKEEINALKTLRFYNDKYDNIDYRNGFDAGQIFACNMILNEIRLFKKEEKNESVSLKGKRYETIVIGNELYPATPEVMDRLAKVFDVEPIYTADDLCNIYCNPYFSVSMSIGNFIDFIRDNPKKVKGMLK